MILEIQTLCVEYDKNWRWMSRRQALLLLQYVFEKELMTKPCHKLFHDHAHLSSTSDMIAYLPILKE